MKRKRCLSLILVVVLAFSLVPAAAAADLDTDLEPDSTRRIYQTTCPQCLGVAMQEASWSGLPQLIDGYPHGDHLDYNMYCMRRIITSCPSCGYFNDVSGLAYYGNWCPLEQGA